MSCPPDFKNAVSRKTHLKFYVLKLIGSTTSILQVQQIVKKVFFSILVQLNNVLGPTDFSFSQKQKKNVKILDFPLNEQL